MARVAGVVTIAADGYFLVCKGDCKVKGSVKREMKTGPNGPAGYSEVYEAPEITVSAILVPELDVDVIEDLRDALIQVDGANGWTYVLRGGVCTGEIEQDVVDGSTSFTFQGMSLERFKR